MAFDKQAALNAGYTEQEIDSYLQNQPEAPPPPTTTEPGAEMEPPAPTTEVTPVEPSFAAGATTAALGAAPYVVPAAAAAGALAGGNKLYGAWNASAEAAKSLADAKMASEQGIAQRAAQKMGAPGPSGPKPMPGYGPTTYNAPVANAPVAPMAQPTAAAPPSAPAAQSSMMTKASDVVRKLALDKVLKGAGVAAGAYELGQGLFGTSPEEIATMKQAEARKRAQGWKPMNER